ncbi:hypothetical protein KFE25_006226 [Diacronema lutheri]|uniref:Uncharacterized protein n=1 Tax=Diacronema lutheri TaxID=2081491 RepID=A0A8J5XVI4_DIALT|nr:hypothetical protein KFE25_006226 [Diacronema lutheri]
MPPALDDALWQRIAREELQTIILDNETRMGDVDTEVALQRDAAGAFIALVAEECTRLGPDARHGGLAASHVVSLDLASASLRSFACDSVCVLMDLNLSNNALLAVPRSLGEHAPHLRRLDLSFNVGLDVCAAGCWDGLANVRALVLEGCGLGVLAPSAGHLRPLARLAELVVADNPLKEVSAFQCLRGLPLEAVDASDCPAAEDAPDAFQKALVALCGPRLRTLNKANLPRSAGASARAWDQLETAQARAERSQRLQEDLSADGRSREGCSCIHGNACDDEYTCLVWARRHDVAAAVKSGRLDVHELMRAAGVGRPAIASELKAVGIEMDS